MSNHTEKAPSNVKSAPPSSVPAAVIKPEQRQTMIAEAAYYLAMQRNFEPGHDVEDWLLAERQVIGALASGASTAKRQ